MLSIFIYFYEPLVEMVLEQQIMQIYTCCVWLQFSNCWVNIRTRYTYHTSNIEWCRLYFVLVLYQDYDLLDNYKSASITADTSKRWSRAFWCISDVNAMRLANLLGFLMGTKTTFHLMHAKQHEQICSSQYFKFRNGTINQCRLWNCYTSVIDPWVPMNPCMSQVRYLFVSCISNFKRILVLKQFIHNLEDTMVDQKFCRLSSSTKELKKAIFKPLTMCSIPSLTYLHEALITTISSKIARLMSRTGFKSRCSRIHLLTYRSPLEPMSSDCQRCSPNPFFQGKLGFFMTVLTPNTVRLVKYVFWLLDFNSLLNATLETPLNFKLKICHILWVYGHVHASNVNTFAKSPT